MFIEDPENASLSCDISQTSLESCLEEARSFFLEKDFVSLIADTAPDVALRDDKESISTFLPKVPDCNVDIFILCSAEDSESCSLLQNIITSQNECLVVKISTNENASTCLTYLDKARLVIPLLSASFVQSSELVHELNIAWCRQRDCSNLCFLAIVLEQLPKSPTYVSLFPCFFNCKDKVWTKDRETLKLFSSDELTRTYRSCECPLNVVLCLMIAMQHVLRWYGGECCPVLGVHNKLTNCLQLSKCIQRHKQILSAHADNKVEKANDITVSYTSPKQVTNEKKDTYDDAAVCIESGNSFKPSELEHVKDNGIQSQGSIPVQEVKIIEERDTSIAPSIKIVVVEDEGKEQENATEKNSSTCMII